MSANSTKANLGGGDGEMQGAKNKKFAGNVSDKVGRGELKARPANNTNGGGGRGMGLMKKPANAFGAGGKHKFAGKLRSSSPAMKKMMLSRHLSYKISKRYDSGGCVRRK